MDSKLKPLGSPDNPYAGALDAGNAEFQDLLESGQFKPSLGMGPSDVSSGLGGYMPTYGQTIPMGGILPNSGPTMGRGAKAPPTPKYNPAARDLALRQLAAAPVPAAAQAPAATPGAPAPAAGQPSGYSQEWDRLQQQANANQAAVANVSRNPRSSRLA